MNETLTGMGQRIFSLRKKKGLTQEGLANLAGVSYQTISTAELGKKALRPKYCETQSGTWSFNGLFADWKTQSNRSILTKRQIIRS